jgi:uncharacterized protein YuzE
MNPIAPYLSLLPNVEESPSHAVWMTYDPEADVLYVNFARPSPAADSELTDEDVIIRYDAEDRIIGYTILHARQR